MNRLSIAFGFSLLLVTACGETEEAPPEALAPALGGLSGVEIPDGEELLVYDLERLRRAGLADPEGAIPRLVRALVAPSTWEKPRRIEIRDGRLLAVHEPTALEEVGRFLAALEERADRGIELDVEVLGSRAGSLDIASLLVARDTGEARTLGRLAFQLANGRWGRLEARREGTYVAGLERTPGGPEAALRMSPLVDGVAADAGVWLEPNDRAVLHLLLTLRTSAGDSREIDVPGAGEVPGYRLELPRRLTVQFRGQLALFPDRWETVAVGPSPVPGEVLHVIARARWKAGQEGPVEGVGSREGTVVASYPLAFPPPRAPDTIEEFLFTRKPLGPDLEEKWQEIAFRTQTKETERTGRWGSVDAPLEDVLFGVPGAAAGDRDAADVKGRIESLFATAFGTSSELSSEGGLTLQFGYLDDDSAKREWIERAVSKTSRKHPPVPGYPVDPEALPLLSEELESKWAAIQKARWEEGMAIALAYDRIFLRQSGEVAAEVESLMGGLHEWRNRPIPIRLRRVEIELGELATLGPGPLDPERAAALAARGEGLEIEARTRPGAWTRLASSETSAVLDGHLAPGLASPPLASVSRGYSVALRPRLYGDGRVEVEVLWYSSDAAPGTLEVGPFAGGFAQRPELAEERIEGFTPLAPGGSALLLGKVAAGGTIPGLLVESLE
ncbi:MAG: hypothetical protein HY720_33065 [Planctomycetes bacterium]|nr:hypothetical protein [Planctomycetota bacterium]